MPITLTLGDCLNAEHALTHLAAQPAPAKTAYRVAKLLRLVRAETAHFHEQRHALIHELGAPNPANATEITVTSENAAAFVARLNELAAVPVDLPSAPLTLADVDAVASLCANDMIRLGPCLTWDDEPIAQ